MTSRGSRSFVIIYCNWRGPVMMSSLLKDFVVVASAKCGSTSNGKLRAVALSQFGKVINRDSFLESALWEGVRVMAVARVNICSERTCSGSFTWVRSGQYAFVRVGNEDFSSSWAFFNWSGTCARTSRSTAPVVECSKSRPHCSFIPCLVFELVAVAESHHDVREPGQSKLLVQLLVCLETFPNFSWLRSLLQQVFMDINAPWGSFKMITDWISLP